MSQSPWRSAFMPVAAVFLSGCVAGAAGGAVLNAALNTGVALGTSAVSRSQGGCYAACPAGTRCNAATGYCDPLPCRGECDPYEECIEDKLVYQCVARTPYNGNIVVNPTEPRPPEPRTDVPRVPRLSTGVPRPTPLPAEEERTADPTP